MKNIKNLFVLTALVAITVAISCRKKDEFKKYVEGGEIQYIAKVDSLKFQSGYERAQLYWLLISDPRITSTKIYWNSRKDSLLLDVKRSAGVDTFRQMISDLEEGSYEFEILNYDNQGHYSVPAKVNGNVYGPKYEASLSNRRVSQAFKMQTGPDSYNAMILWREISIYDGIVSLQVEYKNAFDEQKTIFQSGDPAIMNTVMQDYVPGTSFSYRTGYKPDSLAIDTFYASTQSLIIN